MNLNSISNQLLFTTVRIIARWAGGGRMISTGFLVFADSPKGTVPLLVTCAHSVDGADVVELSCVQATASGEPLLGSKVDFRLSKRDVLTVMKTDAALDISIIPFGPLLNHAVTAG